MKVILTEDIKSLGRQGEVKDVKNGFARNHLLPKKLAVKATPGNLKIWEQKSKTIEAQQSKLEDEAQTLASRLEGTTVRIEVKVGEEDKIFGSVTSQNISDSLNEIGFDVPRKQIELDNPIKSTGTYDIEVKLHTNVSATIKVEVVSEETEPDTEG